MYLKNILVRNYMVHRNTEIQLLPLTVFVGPNSGGKSAFFDALLNFSMLSRGSLRQAFGPYPYSYSATVYRGASSIDRIAFDVSMAKSKDDAEWLRYQISYRQLSGGPEPQYMIVSERLSAEPSGRVLFDRDNPGMYKLSKSLNLGDDRSVFAAMRLAYAQGQEVEADSLVTYCAAQVSRFSKFRLDPTVLASPSRLPEPKDGATEVYVPRLGYHGEDLASVLYHLNENNAPELETIKDAVREIAPEFEDFEFNLVGTDRIAFSVKYTDERGSVPAVRLSSGLLAFIGLMVLIFGPTRTPVLMIEEPENGLTPQAVKAFYRAVRCLEFDGDSMCQVLLSSHSPFVICEAWNGDDRDFIHRVEVRDGEAVIRRFSDVIEEHGIQLRKTKQDGRTQMGLQTAEDVMSGIYCQ